jgi:hypothetical protein
MIQERAHFFIRFCVNPRMMWSIVLKCNYVYKETSLIKGLYVVTRDSSEGGNLAATDASTTKYILENVVLLRWPYGYPFYHRSKGDD